MLPECFLCGKPTLGLTGQDLNLDPEMLIWRGAPEDTIREVMQAQAYGCCHIVCLRQSRWLGVYLYWIQAGFKRLEKVDERTYVHVPPRAERRRMRLPDELTVITSDCVTLALRREHVVGAKAVAGGHLLPVRGDFVVGAEDLVPSEESRLQLMAKEHEGRLSRLLALLRVMDRLAYPEAIEHAVFYPTLSGRDRVQFQIEYSVFVHEGLIEWCIRHGRPALDVGDGRPS